MKTNTPVIRKGHTTEYCNELPTMMSFFFFSKDRTGTCSPRSVCPFKLLKSQQPSLSLSPCLSVCLVCFRAQFPQIQQNGLTSPRRYSGRRRGSSIQIPMGVVYCWSKNIFWFQWTKKGGPCTCIGVNQGHCKEPTAAHYCVNTTCDSINTCVRMEKQKVMEA